MYNQIIIDGSCNDVCSDCGGANKDVGDDNDSDGGNNVSNDDNSDSKNGVSGGDG